MSILVHIRVASITLRPVCCLFQSYSRKCFERCQWVLNCRLAVMFRVCCDVYLERSVCTLALLTCRAGVALSTIHRRYYEISSENKYPKSGAEVERRGLAPEDALIATHRLLSLAFMEAWP